MTTVVSRSASPAPSITDQPWTDTDQRHLEWAAWFFTVAVLIHNADHVRRNAGALSHDVFAAGTAAMVVEVAVVVAVFLRHRLAPLLAAMAGASLAAGYVVVHFTPARGWLSDSLLSRSHLVSIGAAGLETMAAIVLGTIGADIVWRTRAASSNSRRLAAPPEAVNWRRAVTHPAVMAMAAGNAIMFVISLVQVATR
jgi:hypothetical protein